MEIGEIFQCSVQYFVQYIIVYYQLNTETMSQRINVMVDVII